MTTKIRQFTFLICGLGSIGYRHLKVLKGLGEHTILAFRTGKATIDMAAGQSSNLTPDKVFTNFDAALAEKIDAVLVTNPTHLHLDLALKAVHKGLPVFIEKPLDCDLDKARAFAKVAMEQKVPVLVGYNMIFHPAIAKMRELMEDNAIGEAIAANVHWGSYMPGWHPWEDYKETYAARSDMGGGVILTMCHELNYLTEFFGKASACKAMEIRKPTIGIAAEEGVNILLHHASDVVSNIHLNFIQKPSLRRCEVIGQNGTLSWDYSLPQIDVANEEQSKAVPLGESVQSLLDESYTRQMEHFLDVVEKKEEPCNSLAKAVEDLELYTNILKEIGR